MNVIDLSKCEGICKGDCKHYAIGLECPPEAIYEPRTINKTKVQKAVLTFTDSDDGQLHIQMKFDPEISDETRSGAVSCALRCMDYITGTLAK